MADADRRAAVARHPSTTGRGVNLPDYLDDVVRPLGESLGLKGPWHHEREHDGLVLYDVDGEPIALVYAGLPTALYLESVAPSRLLGGST